MWVGGIRINYIAAVILSLKIIPWSVIVIAINGRKSACKILSRSWRWPLVTALYHNCTRLSLSFYQTTHSQTHEWNCVPSTDIPPRPRAWKCTPSFASLVLYFAVIREGVHFVVGGPSERETLRNVAKSEKATSCVPSKLLLYILRHPSLPSHSLTLKLSKRSISGL